MRTQGRPLLMERAINGIISQSFTDWELVIVGKQGARDAIAPLLEPLPTESRERISCICPDVSTEGAFLNAGLEALGSRFVHVHDEADFLHPEFLNRAVHYLRDAPHPSVKGVVTGSEQVYERLGHESIEIIRREPYNDWLRHISLRRLLAENVFPPIAFLFERGVCEETGAFNESLPVLWDWEFNVRFLARFEIGVIPESLACRHQPDTPRDGQAQRKLFFDNLLRNEWLRSDIGSGRTGPGLIANEARMLRNLTNRFKRRSLRLFKKK